MPELTTTELLAIRHDVDDPLSTLNRIEAARLAALIERSCPHCRVNADVVPMSGNGWSVHHGHQPDCPDRGTE